MAAPLSRPPGEQHTRDVAALAGLRTLTETIDAQLIADGYDPECVTWVCTTHRRHCTHLGTEHAEHACWIGANCGATEDDDRCAPC